MLAVQRSFDDLGTPLCDVTFVVLDLETTGGSANGGDMITEVGAAKYRGGECLGTFATLVNPDREIPPSITYLTGITEAMVLPAPRIEEVLPAFLEFAGDAVLVGHNVRFDMSFLQAAMQRTHRPRITNRVIDTCALARRLVSDEVPNCKLSTLARHFRTSHTPTHRALDDTLATAELLHSLLERAGSLGVTALDDLIDLPSVKGHPQLSKLRLTAGLPRAPGVYIFRDRTGRPLYVGKAIDLRRRVRSYFTGDTRRKVGQLLRETQAIDHIVCAHELEASVLEVRLIHSMLPRFNRQSKVWRKYAYLKLTLDERFPRLSVVRAVKADGGLYLGPLPSSNAAQLVAEAIESAVPIRRCRRPVRKLVLRPAPCTPAQLGVATCPCAGAISETEYGRLVDDVVVGLTVDPARLLEPLVARMRLLSEAHRFEEAGSVRDRLDALTRALSRQRRLDALCAAGRVTVEVLDGGGATIENGRLLDAWSEPQASGRIRVPSAPENPPRTPLACDAADEVACIAAWLDREAPRLRLISCGGELTSTVPRVPRFSPAEKPERGRRER
ncbi:MAG TPA: DEDD exonuclease domain-containing protein [Acidimicrobiales bacterium]|nr:DEDD exonuclease domain-containing protein [Acidimicrobiales bacterium]